MSDRSHTKSRGKGTASRPRKAVATTAPASKYLYLYYLTPDGAGDWEVQAFFHKAAGNIGDVNGLVQQLAKDARDGNLTAIGWSLGDLVWHRKCYLAYVLNDPANKIFKTNPVTFAYTGPGQPGGNHTFRDKGDMTDFDTCTGAYYFNHLDKKGGGNWGHHEHEHFDIAVNIVARVGPGPGGPPDHNGSGTNTGPPLP